ncbi:hypothetical protein BH10PSE5_BH10PSE5_19540 [soil metagenome]
MSAYDDAAARLDQAPATPYYNLAAKSVANPGGLGGYGHRTSLFSVLADILIVAAETIARAFSAGQSAAAASASAASALSAPGTNGTSAASLLIATGAKVFASTQAGKSWVTGMWVLAASQANPANFMVGQVTGYAGTALTLNVTFIGGSGTFADWVLSVTAPGGAFIPSTRNFTAAGLVTGGGNGTADRTFTVTAAGAAEVWGGSDTTKAITAGAMGSAAIPQTLTDAATVNWNMASGFNAAVTLGGNRTIAAPTNPKRGFTYALEVLQPAAGGPWIPSLNAAFEFGAAGLPAFSAAANKRDVIFAYCYDAATPKFRCSFNRDS